MRKPINPDKEIIEEVEFNYKDYIVNPESINSDLDDFISGRIPQGFKSGCHILDNHFVAKKNEFYIVTGKKGQGKTTIYQILQLMFSITNNLKWVVAFQENSNWSMKYSLMNYLLSGYTNEIKKTNPKKYNIASYFIDKHFIFIKVEDIKTATLIAKGLIDDGVDIHGLLLDPINSFKSGWYDTGNGYQDGINTSLEMLKFAKETCSIHITQHPNMSGQRQEGAVSSYQAEGGWFLNKAHNTCAINRDYQGTMLPSSKGHWNMLSVENVRNKFTGGAQTEKENPVIIEWSPTDINIFMKDTPQIREDKVIAGLVKKYGIFGNNDVPKITSNEAFIDVPF